MGAMHAQELARPAPIAERPLRAVERADPEPGPGELRLRVTACGVCRTDLQLVTGDLQAHALPVIPGHQVVGRVDAVGDGVDGWSVGDRAGVGWLASACGNCDFCRRGVENLCRDARFTGWDRDGGYAGVMTSRADFAFHLPDGFDDLDAAPLLCGGVIGYRALKLAGAERGGRLGLYGFGNSARLAIQVALHWGSEVYVVTRGEAGQRQARDFGATWAGGTDDVPPVPLDAAVTFAPVGEVIVEALRAMDRGGTVVVNAIHLDRVPQFDYDMLWLERSIKSVANYTRADAREFLALAARLPVRTLYDTAPLADANAALERMDREGGERTPVLTME